MKGESRPSGLGLAAGLYLAFCLVVALSNAVARYGAVMENEGLEAAGGFLLLVGAMVGLGLVLPLYLEQRGRVELPLLPTERRHRVVWLGLLAALLFGRSGYLVDLFQSPPPLGPSLAVFLGPLLVHLASMIACFGMLLPPLRRRWGTVPAVLLTAVAWCAYHLLQFHFFPEGSHPALQFELFSFGLGYSLFYLWSGSLLYTYALQHLVAVSTFIYRHDFGFGEVDEAFVLGLVVTLTALTYMLWIGSKKRAGAL